MHTVTRPFGPISGLIRLSFLAEAAIVFLSAWFNLGTLILLLLLLPIGIYALSALPPAVSKIGRLLRQLRWWHLLWLFAFASGLVFRVRTTEAGLENPFDIWAFYRVGLMGLVALVLLGRFCMQRRGGLRMLFSGPISWLTAYALVGVLSTLWSVYPSWTFYKSVEYLMDVALIAAIVASVRSTAQFKTLFDWTWLLLGLLLASVWLGIILWPDQAVIHGVGLLGIQIQGVMPAVAANGVGDLGGSLGIVAFVRWLFGRGVSRSFYLVLFLVAIVTLIFAQSRSPLTGFLLGLVLVLFVARKIGAIALIGLLLPGVAILTPLGNTLWQFFLRNQSEELFFSLSGRLYWWQAAWPLILDNLFLGMGAYAAGRFIVAAQFSETLSSLHGTWPEVLIGTGMLGLLPLIGAVVGTWFALMRSRGYRTEASAEQLRLEAIGVMCILTVRSIFTVSFIWHPAMTWLLALGYSQFLMKTHTRPCRPQPFSATRRLGDRSKTIPAPGILSIDLESGTRLKDDRGA